MQVRFSWPMIRPYLVWASGYAGQMKVWCGWFQIRVGSELSTRTCGVYRNKRLVIMINPSVSRVHGPHVDLLVGSSKLVKSSGQLNRVLVPLYSFSISLFEFVSLHSLVSMGSISATSSIMFGSLLNQSNWVAKVSFSGLSAHLSLLFYCSFDWFWAVLGLQSLRLL